jgi:hypothetical protein
MSLSQRSSSRTEQLAVAKEKRRLAELEAAALAQRQLEEQRREKCRRVANRLFGQLEAQCNEDGVVEFDIPTSWKPKAPKGGDSKELKRAPRERSYQKYRTIWRNLYRSPLVRDGCALDEVPLCSCSPAEGCGDYCQNRLLFM